MSYMQESAAHVTSVYTKVTRRNVYEVPSEVDPKAYSSSVRRTQQQRGTLTLQRLHQSNVVQRDLSNTSMSVHLCI